MTSLEDPGLPPGTPKPLQRHLGLFGATTIGISAMLGAGIFVLSGVALRVAGPGALLTFALSGLLAFVTAFSFAELASAFPESGGSYVFAKRVFPIGGAFASGWILWLAYPVAAALYALGFASFVDQALERFGGGLPPGAPPLVAGAALLAGAALQSLRGAAGGNAVTIAKVVAFLVLVVPGLALLAGRSPGALTTSLTPFLPHGLGGVLAAMTFTFIALEGFEVIAAVSEEVKQPIRTIPRAMFLSIGGTLALYLLLLFLLLTLGGSWEELGRLGERAVAVGVERYLGSFGTWVVVVAGLLATFTALSSALLAASRVAFAMARDRALPRPLMRTSRGGIPRQALGVSLGLALLLVAVTRDVETAGATASLIFLLSFAFTNGAGLLVRVRGGAENGYRAPLYPMLPLCGIAGCLALSALQVVTAPLASAVAAGWLGLGVLIYWVMFREHAERVSARMEALDEDLVRLRGRRPPLVLVPLANPARAAALTSFAYALAPQGWGRVLGLTVVTHDPQGAVPEEFSAKLEAAQAAQRAAAHRASELGIGFEGVLTVDADFVRATRRLIRERAPEVVLFGMSRLDRPGSGGFLERVVADSPSDVVILNAPEDFSPDRVERILVPVAGAASHDPLRARVLGMLERAKPREVTLLRVVSKPEEAPAAAKQLAELAEDLGAARHLVEVGDFLPILLTHARQADLVVLGSSRRPGTPLLGSFVRTLAAEPDVCLLALARRTP